MHLPARAGAAEMLQDGGAPSPALPPGRTAGPRSCLHRKHQHTSRAGAFPSCAQPGPSTRACSGEQADAEKSQRAHSQRPTLLPALLMPSTQPSCLVCMNPAAGAACSTPARSTLDARPCCHHSQDQPPSQRGRALLPRQEEPSRQEDADGCRGRDRPHLPRSWAPLVPHQPVPTATFISVIN